MIIRLRPGVTIEQLQEVVRRIEERGLRAEMTRGDSFTFVTAVGETHMLDENVFRELEWVEAVERLSRPYRLVYRRKGQKTRPVRVGDVVVGEGRTVIMAGPCAVEDHDGVLTLAQKVQRAGAEILRGGAYKPRTSPYSFQGQGEKGLAILREARSRTGLPILTEATGTHHHPRPDGTREERTVLEQVVESADAVQIGSRNMKSYGLLEAAGKLSGEAGKPVLLKRGEAATLEEFLLAAEYLALHGNPEIILCLRGIRTFESSSEQRYTADIAAIAVLKRETNLPVIFDPSHATGDRRLVPAVSLAAVAAGADGLLIECHQDPHAAWSDGAESITPEELASLVDEVRRIETSRQGAFLPR
jgi:3-deoxy-7-phosphoheptulonate synthase